MTAALRHRFADPKDAREARARKPVVTAIDRFWKAFAKKSKDLDALFSGRIHWDLPKWMDAHLGAVDRRLMWEYGPAIGKKGHRLVVSSESKLELQPLVDLVLARAPRLSGWQFLPHRPAERIAMLEPTLTARTGRATPPMRVVVKRDNDALALVFHIEGCTGEDDEDASATAYVTSEVLLGEGELKTWVASIEVAPMRKVPRGAVPVEKLAKTFAAAVRAQLAKVPRGPCRGVRKSRSVALLEAQPTKRKVYRGRTDAFVFVTARTDILLGSQELHPFASARFSRAGETFAYVKFDGSKGLGDSPFEDREDIENALDDALAPKKLGTVFGGGTGLRYSYVDLALEDLDRGVSAVRKALQKGRVPLRTWILFFDDTLTNEWVGIYDDTPAPPGMARPR
jgi:hypothetical protein